MDGDLAQDGQVAGCRPIPDAAVILPEGDIEDPMEPIFDGPMPADRLNQHPGSTANEVSATWQRVARMGGMA